MTINALYQKDLLRHAADASHAGRLDMPDASAEINNPLCGDKVTLDLTLDDDGKVQDARHDTQACALCQASVAILTHQLPGLDAEAAAAGEEAVRQLLEDDAPAALPNPWQDYEIFTAVRDHKPRHQCVLLPFEAAITALNPDQSK